MPTASQVLLKCLAHLYQKLQQEQCICTVRSKMWHAALLSINRFQRLLLFFELLVFTEENFPWLQSLQKYCWYPFLPKRERRGRLHKMHSHNERLRRQESWKLSWKVVAMNLRSCPPGLDIGLINQRAKGFLMSDLKWKTTEKYFESYWPYWHWKPYETQTSCETL